MSEVLVQFDEPQRSADGRAFVAQVCGQRTLDGLWEAWIQFSPMDGGEPVDTGRVTEQLSRGDLRFWAAGLTRAFLDSALAEALSPQAIGRIGGAHALHHAFDVSDAYTTESEFVMADGGAALRPYPVLDPFALYARGEYALRQELRALDASHLRDIIVAFELPEIDVVGMARTFEDALMEQIVAGVQQRSKTQLISQRLQENLSPPLD